MSDTQQTKNVGRVVQIIGPVLDIVFAKGQVPNIYNALTIKSKNATGVELAVTVEVQQLLGDNAVRAVSMQGTDGLMRGMEVLDTGKRATRCLFKKHKHRPIGAHYYNPY